jgi:NADP-dependent 3-hydroxy acid dehydrogenase YdfG
MTSIHNNNDISKGVHILFNNCSTLYVADGYDLVLVTGATGYIASHCVQQLLASGCYRVRGTVRQLSNRQKIAPLLALPGADDRLELVEADLEKKDDWPSYVI